MESVYRDPNIEWDINSHSTNGNHNGEVCEASWMNGSLNTKDIVHKSVYMQL